MIRKYGSDMRGCKIYIYRFNTAAKSPFGREALGAKPCLLCQHLLKQADIGKVVFVEDGSVKDMRARDMVYLVDSPSNLTRLFLYKNADCRHGKFKPQDFLPRNYD